jgi:hypothetical protein
VLLHQRPRTGQTEISDVFSSRIPAPGGDKFNAVTVETMATGAPRLTEALVSFDCRLISAERIGTHHICIGEVAAVITEHAGEPLALRAAQIPAPRGALGGLRHLHQPREKARPDGRDLVVEVVFGVMQPRARPRTEEQVGAGAFLQHVGEILRPHLAARVVVTFSAPTTEAATDAAKSVASASLIVAG